MGLDRRSALAGLGSLAFGSGAVFSRASFNGAVNSGSDLRAVAVENLVVEAGNAFNDDGSVAQSPGNNGESYVDFSKKGSFFDASGGLDQIDTNDLPVATVIPRDQKNNGGVIVRKAVDFEHDTYEFKNILRLRNNTDQKVENIGIKYDGGYGSAVQDSSNNINKQLVQYMYRFLAGDPNSLSQISPDGSNSKEDPAGTVDLPSGDTINITLKLDFSQFSSFGNTIKPKERIKNVADTGNPFVKQIDTVQLLDNILIGESWS